MSRKSGGLVRNSKVSHAIWHADLFNLLARPVQFLSTSLRPNQSKPKSPARSKGPRAKFQNMKPHLCPFTSRRDFLRQRRQLRQADMGFQSIDKNLHRIVPPHFESGHDGHEKRLSLRPRIATTRENVRADQNSRTDSPLPSIVIRLHFFVIKECERFVSMATLCPFLLFSTAFRP